MVLKNCLIFWALFEAPFDKFNSHEDSYQEILNGIAKLLIRKTNKGAIRYTKYYSYYKKEGQKSSLY